MLDGVDNSVFSTISSQFQSSCIELFKSFDCEITRTEKQKGIPEAYLASIDAGSDDVEITIALLLPMSVLSMTYPATASDILSADEAMLEDWISELSNQLIGRFKNKMLQYNCTLNLGLPTASCGASSIELSVERHEKMEFDFEVDREVMKCAIYIQVFNDNLTLEQNADASPVMVEGDIELF